MESTVSRSSVELTDLAQRLEFAHRARELGSSCLKLREQTDVFDGNDCLIRKGFQQFDVFVREVAGLRAINDNRTDGTPAAKQWHAK